MRTDGRIHQRLYLIVFLKIDAPKIRQRHYWVQPYLKTAFDVFEQRLILRILPSSIDGNLNVATWSLAFLNILITKKILFLIFTVSYMRHISLIPAKNASDIHKKSIFFIFLI
jgi:hypothetical protein